MPKMTFTVYPTIQPTLRSVLVAGHIEDDQSTTYPAQLRWSSTFLVLLLVTQIAVIKRNKMFKLYRIP